MFKSLESPSQRLMGIGKKVVIDLKIANTMHLRGISVALFEVGGPPVSPSLVMKKQQERWKPPVINAQKIMSICGRC